MDQSLLPARSRWFLTTLRGLSRRERRRLRRNPALRAQQRAWVAAYPERLNLAFERACPGFTRDGMISPAHPLLTYLPTSK